jgi:hypothetical protein
MSCLGPEKKILKTKDNLMGKNNPENSGDPEVGRVVAHKIQGIESHKCI